MSGYRLYHSGWDVQILAQILHLCKGSFKCTFKCYTDSVFYIFFSGLCYFLLLIITFSNELYPKPNRSQVNNDYDTDRY